MNPAAQAASLTRAEAAYDHLASFKLGDRVAVKTPQRVQYGNVTGSSGTWVAPDDAYLTVTWHPSAARDGGAVRVTVDTLLTGEHCIAAEADAAAGNWPCFDANAWAIRNQEGSPAAPLSGYTGRPGCPCGGWGVHICPVPDACLAAGTAAARTEVLAIARETKDA